MSDPTPALDNGQLAAILSVVLAAAGILGQAIRWSAKRIIKALDANSESNTELTAKLAVFTVRIEDITRFIDEYTPPPQEMPKPPRRVTPARGTEYHVRPKTRGGDE